MIVNFQHLHELFFCWEKTNEDISAKQVCTQNALYEYPILEQFLGKCCSFFSCQDSPSKLRWDISSMVTCPQSTQHKTYQHEPKNSCKPANFRQILQFTCEPPTKHTGFVGWGGGGSTHWLILECSPFLVLLVQTSANLNWCIWSEGDLGMGHKKVKHSWAVVCWIGPGGPMSGNLSSDRSQWRHLWNF